MAPLGDVVDGDLFRGLASDENDFIPDLGLGNIGEINHDGVHGSGSDDRGLAAMEEDPALVSEARETVAVTEREDADATWGLAR